MLDVLQKIKVQFRSEIFIIFMITYSVSCNYGDSFNEFWYEDF